MITKWVFCGIGAKYTQRLLPLSGDLSMPLDTSNVRQRLGRVGAGLATVLVLVALAVGACTVLAPDLLDTLHSSDTALVNSGSPLDLNGPALSVAQVNSWEGELNQVVASGSRVTGDVQLLDEWFYTAYLKYSSTAK
jgi:hypothetical protein